MTAALRAELEQATLEGLRSLAIGVLILGAVFLPFDVLRLGPPLAVPALLHDLVIMAVAGGLWWAVDLRHLPARIAAPAAVAFALLVLSNVLRPRGIDAISMTQWVAVILIGVGTFVLPRGWMASGVIGVCAGWAATVGHQPWSRLGHLAFTLVAGLAVAFPMHFARRRSHARIVRLRQTDEARQEELQRALEAAEEARRTLDDKVAARTGELSRTAAELRTELAERQREAGERIALEARLQHDALHDALTSLPNRALFLDRLGHAWHRMSREAGFRFAVLYLDLDRFKVINDTFGHDVGDQLLVGIGKRLPGCLRPTDTVARLGGDEFAVLLEGFRNAAETLAIAERIHAALRVPFRIDAHEF